MTKGRKDKRTKGQKGGAWQKFLHALKPFFFLLANCWLLIARSSWSPVHNVVLLGNGLFMQQGPNP